MTPTAIAVAVSCLALAISALTFWFSFLHKGRLRMTKPRVIFLGPDGRKENGEPKVYMRMLLYSTGKRGQLVESLFVRLRRGESVQTFNVWVYGDQHLSTGSGLFVGPEGVSHNHHFLHPRDGTPFEFLPGEYRMEVFANVVGRQGPLSLGQTTLALTQEFSDMIRSKRGGVYFDWGPESGSYHASMSKRQPPEVDTDPISAMFEAMIPPDSRRA